MSYKKRLPEEPGFSQKGLKGFTYPLDNKEIEINYVDVTKGHDKYLISKKCTHIYYILEGEGTFDIDGEEVDAKPGDLIEVLPGIEYVYSGSMKVLLILNPPWFEGNEELTKNNPSLD